MKYRRMGHTGLQLSEVSVGGWITFGGSLSDRVSRQIVKSAIDCGINFVDLADVYGRGRAEEVVGKALSDYRRSDLVISSKVFWPMSDNVNDRGLSRKHILESVEASLRRLKTDYLDIYFCHRADPDTPIEETVAALDHLVRQGKVLYWGTSVWEAEQLADACTVADRRHLTAPRVEQPRYNLLDRHIEAEILPAARRLGMGLVVWSPLAQGMLTGKYNDGVPPGSRAATSNWLTDTLTEANLERTRRFSHLAESVGYPPEQMALAWLLRRPEVTSVILGATSPAHVLENVRCLEVELPDAVVNEIEEIFPA